MSLAPVLSPLSVIWINLIYRNIVRFLADYLHFLLCHIDLLLLTLVHGFLTLCILLASLFVLCIFDVLLCVLK